MFLVSMTSAWDEMRRKARLLENDIDMKLVTLNKISSTTGYYKMFILRIILGIHYSLDQKNSSSKRAAFESLSTDIENLISKLTRANNEVIIKKKSNLSKSFFKFR